MLAPNTELAAALFEAVEREYRGAGRDIWPTPKIRDFGGWLREQYQQRQLDDATGARVLSDVEERELWRAVIDAGEIGKDFIEPGAAARAARAARRVVHEHAIPLARIAREGSEESAAFLHWNGLFDERCAVLDCISMDALLTQTRAPTQPLTWIGSAAWRPAARRWLTAHGRCLAPAAVAAPSTRIVHANSPAAELAAMAAWSQANLANDPEFRAWVCVPDLNRRRTEVVDALDAALAPRRFALPSDQIGAPYAVAGGTPLSGYPSVGAALDLLGATVGALEFARFSALLRESSLHESSDDAVAAAQLDVALRPRAPNQADLTTWLALAERFAPSHAPAAQPLLQRLRVVQRLLDGLRGAHPLSSWGSHWIGAFEAGPWAFRSRWSSTEYQAAERLRELMTSLATADAVLGPHDREGAQRVLRRAAHDTAFQPQTGVPPIWISGQLIDPWLNYDGLWVTSCHDEKWPPPVLPIPLLPVRLQREFGVIAAAPDTQLAHAVGLQAAWQSRADHSVFSFSDAQDGRPGSPSPLLPAAAGAAAAPLSDAVPRPLWRIFQRAAPMLERWTDESGPVFGPDERTRGVATLKAQSRCAFRGFAETRLALNHRLELPVPGYNERERGELVHHALEHIWSALHDSETLLALSAEAQEQVLAQGIAQAMLHAQRMRDPGAKWRGRERERMHHVLGKWLDTERARAPFEVETLEQVAQVARHAGLDFSVRVDRVDRLRAGGRVVIDYKTGNAKQDWRGDRPDNPQLPVYALLNRDALVAVAYGKVNAVEPGFFAEASQGGIFKANGRPTSLEGMPTMAALVDLWSLRIDTLAAAFAAGRAEVAPTAQACKTCRLQALCRIPAALDDTGEDE